MRNHELEVTGQPLKFKFGIQYIDQQTHLRKYNTIQIKKKTIYDMYFLILLSAFVVECIDYTKVYSISNIRNISFGKFVCLFDLYNFCTGNFLYFEKLR